MPSKPKLHQPSPEDVAALIAGVTPPERAVPICMRGDLQADYEVLQQELVNAQAVAGNSDRMGEDPEVTEIRGRMVTLAEEIKAATLVFRMRGIPQPEHLKLEEDHPALDGNARHKERGFNVEAVEQALIRKSCVWPVLTGEQWDVLDASFTVWQKAQLAGGAYSASLREPSVSF